jgi:bifunctional non-homologous end joining protein LigD
MSKIVERTELYSDHNGSDKVYIVTIVEEAADQYVVNYQNGARGSTLAAGTKTKSPVSLDKARSTAASLIKSKVNGDSHYRVMNAESGGDSYVAPVEAKQEAGVNPMLLTVIEESNRFQYLSDPLWIVQEKHDGERCPVIVKNGQVTGANKKGFVRGVPKGLEDVLLRAAGTNSFVLDGELIGDRLYVFDMLELNGQDLRSRPLRSRLSAMATVFGIENEGPFFTVVETPKHEDKQAFIDAVRARSGEGVVWKDLMAPYEGGRSDRVIKDKFVDECTVVVVAHNDKRSVTIGAHDENGVLQEMCSQTIPANAPIPAVGSCIEVRYLYAFPNTYALHQGTYKGPRPDQSPADCKLADLKLRAPKPGLRADPTDAAESVHQPTKPPVRRMSMRG